MQSITTIGLDIAKSVFQVRGIATLAGIRRASSLVSSLAAESRPGSSSK